MQIYKYLIFDVDDTLLDFYPAFVTAQRNIAKKFGKVCDVQEVVNCYLKSISSSKVLKEPDTLSAYVKLSR